MSARQMIEMLTALDPETKIYICHDEDFYLEDDQEPVSSHKILTETIVRKGKAQVTTKVILG